MEHWETIWFSSQSWSETDRLFLALSLVCLYINIFFILFVYLLIWLLFCLRLFISSSSYVIEHFGHALVPFFWFTSFHIFASQCSVHFLCCFHCHCVYHCACHCLCVCVHHYVCVCVSSSVCVNTWPLSLLKLSLPVFALCTLCVACWWVWFFVIQLILWYFTESNPTVLWKCWKTPCAFQMLEAKCWTLCDSFLWLLAENSGAILGGTVV